MGAVDILLKLSAKTGAPLYNLKYSVNTESPSLLVLPALIANSDNGMPHFTLISSDYFIPAVIIVYLAVLLVVYLGAQWLEISIFTPITNISSCFAGVFPMSLVSSI